MRISVPLHNVGDYRLVHNDIAKLYDDIFVKTERTMFNLKGDAK